MLRTPQHTHRLNIDIRCDAKEGTSIRTAESVIRVTSCAKTDLDSICKRLFEFLTNEGISCVALEKSKFNMKFVKLFASKYPGCKIEFCFMKEKATVEDPELKRIIVNDYHHLPTGGHAGINRMQRNIQRKYTWPGLLQEIKEYVARCIECKKSKINKNTKRPMEITTCANE